MSRSLQLYVALAIGLVNSAIAFFAGASGALQSPQQGRPYDVLIRGGRILDGSGNPWFRGDVAIRDGRIAGVGRLRDAPAARTIAAGERIVAPGFIDVHSHAAEGLAREGL